MMLYSFQWKRVALILSKAIPSSWKWFHVTSRTSPLSLSPVSLHHCSPLYYQFPRAALTKCYKLSGLKEQQLTLPAMAARVLKHSVCRAMLSLKALGENSSCLLPSFWWWLAVLGIPWLVDASLQFLPPHSFIKFFLVSVYLCPVHLFILPSSYKHVLAIGLGPTVIQQSHVFTRLYLQIPYSI